MSNAGNLVNLARADYLAAQARAGVEYARTLRALAVLLPEHGATVLDRTSGETLDKAGRVAAIARSDARQAAALYRACCPALEGTVLDHALSAASEMDGVAS